MKTTLLTLVSTNAGWITRLALKYVAIGSASLSAWLAAQGVAEGHTAAIAAGVTAGAAALIEQGLSFIARKYAVK
jgi:hypothetical protein